MTDWPFDQAPNVAALTTRQVINGYPILLVIHSSDDHSWAFLCSTSDEDSDARVIGMSEALELDKTLSEIADLPPGWSAQRTHVGAPWIRAFG